MADLRSSRYALLRTLTRSFAAARRPADNPPVVARRIHVAHLRPGQPIELDRAEAHHARDVLRLTNGATVEVFDDAGAVGQGVLLLNGGTAHVQVEAADLNLRRDEGAALRIAAAVPKGERADWMVEKLSELGVFEFVPLAAARSVVLPEGRGKRDRWLRIATESAKQSRRVGVMRIAELTAFAAALGEATRDAVSRAWFFSTEIAEAAPIATAASALPPGAAVTAFVGPEGGWTVAEQQQFLAAGATPVRLTRTVLRIETAAVAAASVVACLAVRTALSAPLDGPRTHDDDPAADATGPGPVALATTDPPTNRNHS